MRRIKNCLTRENGQSMVEYGIIVAFIAVACIAAFQWLGGIALTVTINNAAAL